MEHRVVNKQPNSKMCLVCGLSNTFGLKASFFEVEGDELITIFVPAEVHQGYPGRLHGGIAAAVLDEGIGRAINIKYDQTVWGVTIEFSIRFLKPIPLGVELRVVGRITNEAGRIFEGAGRILLPDGAVAATANGKYMKLPIEKIADFDIAAQEWKVTPRADDPPDFDY